MKILKNQVKFMVFSRLKPPKTVEFYSDSFFYYICKYFCLISHSRLDYNVFIFSI